MAGIDRGDDDVALDATDLPLLRAALDAMLDAVAVNEAERDAEGRIVGFRLIYANRSARDVGGLQTLQRVAGLRFDDPPNALGRSLFDRYVEVVDTGVPLRSSAHRIEQVGADGDTRELWVDLHAVRLGDGCLVAWRDVTERTRADEELRRALDGLHTAERLAHMGSWHVDAGLLRCSSGLAEILGVPPDVALTPEQLWASAAQLAPDSVALLREVARRVRLGQPFEVDAEIVDTGGAAHWVVVRGEPTAAGDGRAPAKWSGTMQDVTQLRRLRELVKALRETQGELKVERDQLDLALAAGQIGRFEWDVASGVVTWDSRLESLFGLRAGHFEGTYDAWMSRVHPDDRAVVAEVLAATAQAGGGAYTFEHRVLVQSGGIAWLEGRGVLSVAGDGSMLGARGVVADITARKESELALARTREHLAVLDRAVLALTSSFDVQTSLRELGRVVVPVVADACEIDLVAGAGFTRVVVGPNGRLSRAREAAPAPTVEWHPLRRVIATGLPMRIDVDTAPELFGPSEDPTSARSMGWESAVIAPLAARGEVLGALTLGRVGGRPTWTDADVRFAVQLAERAALAIDNGRLFADQRDLVERLQMALLPDDIASAPWADVAVRYRAAIEGMQVGGDWYDVVMRRDGVIAVTLGDVVGHGVDAAVLMSRLRNRLRLLLAEATSPLETIDRLDLGAGERMAGDFATVVVGMLDDRGSLTVATAGHPPPLVVEPSKPSWYVDVAPGPPIGVGGGASRSLARAPVAPGAAVVFYTDGLVERRGESIHVGLARLRELCDATPCESADEFADAILAGMLPGGARDDVALAVVRLDRGA